MNLNVLIPMAGNGSRFSSAGYHTPKPMIEVFGQPMIGLVVCNILGKFLKEANLICCVRKNDKDLIELLKIDYTDKIVYVEDLTKGPAATCLLAKHFIDNSSELIITNSDQYIQNFDLKIFLEYCKNFDGVLGTFFSDSLKNSYVKTYNNLAIDIKEKNIISNLATNGLHYWKHGKDFISSAEEMINNNDTAPNGEVYVAPSYNYLIKQGKKIAVYHFNEHYPIGIPEDLNIFKETFKHGYT